MSKKPSFMEKLNQTVSPRARAMIIICLIMSTVVGIMIVRALGHRNQQSTVAAKMDVKMNVADSDMRRPMVGDAQIVPDDSPIASTVREINKTKYETAAQTGGSYIPPIEDKGAAQPSFTDNLVTANDTAVKKEPPQKIATGIDDVIQAQARQTQAYHESRNQGAGANSGSAASAPAAEDRSEYLRALLEKNSKVAERVANAVTAVSTPANTAPAFVEGAKSNTSGVVPVNASAVNDGSEYVAKFSTPNTVAAQGSGVGAQFAAATRNVPGAAEALEAAGISTTGVAGSQVATAQVTSPSSTAKGVKVGRVNLGDKYFASMEGTGNTDEPSELVFTIIQEGPLNGARLIGVPKLVGEKLTIDCTQMTLRGRDYAIKAKIIDIQTGDARLADDVNHHYLSRWGGLGLAAFVDGYARALSGSTTITNGAQTTTTTTPIPDAAGQMKVAIGNVGEKVTPMLQKEFDRPPTVQLFGKDGVGVLFLNSFDLLL